jgi:8-oxo-dGTP diphosphatase
VEENKQLYCLQCGTPLQTKMQDWRLRPVCPECGWVYYDQLKVGSAAVIEQEGSLLLLRRLRQPWQGQWYLPAGFVEVDETPEAAAEREVLEECGLVVHTVTLLDAIYFNDDPRGNGLLLVYQAEISGGKLHNSEEISEYRWFTPEEIPQDIAGAGHKEIILRWKAGQV